MNFKMYFFAKVLELDTLLLTGIAPGDIIKHFCALHSFMEALF